MTRFGIYLFTVGLIGIAFPNSAVGDELQERADTLHRKQQEPDAGIVLAEVDGDEVVFAVTGFLQKDGPVVDENTLFEIGSITKVFTGILLAKLVQNGKADLDDPISKHLPASILPKDSPLASVTLLGLSTHTSGLPRLPGDLERGLKDPADPYAHYSEKRLHKYLKDFKESDFEEKGKQSYSNLGVGLLGHVLEQISGKPYQELLADTILDPIGMNSTFVQRKPGDIPESEYERFATGHTLGAEVGHWHIDVICGAGAIVSSANDLARFAQAHWDDATPAELRSAMDFAMETKRNDMGLGWFKKDDGYWHNGGTGGFRSDLAISPEKRTAEIMLRNSSQPQVKSEITGEFEPISGFWSGVLKAKETELRQFMRISESGQIVLHSLDQALRGIPSSSSSFDGEKLSAVFPGIDGTYEGTLSDDRITGKFEQRYSMPLEFDRSEKLPEKLKNFFEKRIEGDLTKVAGYWSGLIGGEGGLYVILQIEAFDGTGEARLYSPDQMPGALPLDKLKVDGAKVELKCTAVNGTYQAEIDGKTMDGTWNQGIPLPLKLEWSEFRPVRE